MIKNLIQIDTDQNYINQFYTACKTFGDQLNYAGMKDSYISVVNAEDNFRKSIHVVVISLELAGVDVTAMCQSIRSAYPNATLVGLISSNNPYYSSLEGIANTSGIHLVLPKTTAYQVTVQDMLGFLNKPIYQAHPTNIVFETPSIVDGLRSVPQEEQARPSYNNSPPAIVQQTIGVCGSKGGVGKTTISTEIASALAMARNTQYDSKLKVCIVDMDLDYGDVPTIFDIRTAKNIFVWVQDIDEKLKTQSKEEIDFSFDTIAEKYLKFDEDRSLYILLPTPNPLQSVQVKEVHVNIILKHLKKYFHFVVLDLGNNTRDFTILGLLESTDVVLVADFEKTAIKSLKQMMEALKAINFPVSNYNFILNKVEQDVGLEEREIVDVIKTKLGLRYIGSLPYLKQVKRLQNGNRTMIQESYRNKQDNEFTFNIKKILSEITPLFKNVNGGNIKKNQTKQIKEDDGTNSGGIFGFIKRFIGS